MNRKKLPIGIHNFAELISGNYYFVDKSLLIKELLDSGAKVTLLPRPRRFGKTVNMSMIQHFFENTAPSKQPGSTPALPSSRHLFTDLKIAQHPACMAKQGQYPVIFLTFKDVKETSWAECMTATKTILAEEFRRHRYLLESPALDDVQKDEFSAVINKKASVAACKAALKTLTAHLAKHHQKPAILLIDEYDAPVHAAVEHGYYDQIINFMRGFLSSGLKDNSNLEFGVLTGILRIAKESIFSGLNNLRVCTFLEDAYSDKFGLLSPEVAEIISYFGISKDISEVASWYDGYQSGQHKIYNPWSILNMIDTSGQMRPYWINTSDNALLKNVLQNGALGVKEGLEQVMQGKPLTKELDENVVLTKIMSNERTAWSLLFMSGYLTFENYRPDPRQVGSWIADLKVPNTEIAWIYKTEILSWFEGDKVTAQYRSLLQSLVNGDVDGFKELFGDFAMQTLSIFDATGKNPEKFYHGLVLGMLASLRDTHEVVSNRESGIGRYDVCIFPHDPTKPGIIIEFKVVSKAKKETLKTAAQAALRQISEKDYAAAMHARGITNIVKLGIAFQGKKNLVLAG
ncbi:MAG: ATP-binding protein [Candidatus Dependentiae bacterium]|nr:ATP-binding protein [Candidatus Dependentiae bacterium]